MNPRVLLWLRAIKLAPADISRKGEDVPEVSVNGFLLPWTIHYSEWIQARWREWRGSLGYPTKGLTPWHRALAGGHTGAEFDAWLEESVWDECGNTDDLLGEDA